MFMLMCYIVYIVIFKRLQALSVHVRPAKPLLQYDVYTHIATI